MAITMSQAKIDNSARENLLNSSVDTSIFGGDRAQDSADALAQMTYIGEYGGGSNAKLAGVTEDFAKGVTEKIESYCANVEAILKNMESTDSKIAFQGAGIENALSAFITGVKESAFSYLDKLKSAEQQIINSVQTAYATQDTDLSSNLASDTSKLSNQ